MLWIACHLRCTGIPRNKAIGWQSHGKNPVRLYPKLQSQPIGLRKIFIDYFFFQVDQWNCTKPLSIFDRLASSEERFRTFHCTNELQSQPIGLPKIFIDYLFFQADQSDCTKSVSIFDRFASSGRTLKSERSLPNLSPLSFPTRGLGCLVNQRNPSGYWQVTKGDLSQFFSSLHDSFLFRSGFFIRF